MRKKEELEELTFYIVMSKYLYAKFHVNHINIYKQLKKEGILHKTNP